MIFIATPDCQLVALLQPQTNLSLNVHNAEIHTYIQGLCGPVAESRKLSDILRRQATRVFCAAIVYSPSWEATQGLKQSRAQLLNVNFKLKSYHIILPPLSLLASFTFRWNIM